MNKQSKGFSLVIVLITLVAIAALAFGGWFVWQKSQGSTDSKQNNSSQNNTQKPNNNQNEPSDPTEGGKYLVITEWGVRFPLPEELRGDVKYGITIHQEGSQTAWFEVGKLATLPGSNCQLKEITSPNASGRDGGIGVALNRTFSQEDAAPYTIKHNLDRHWYYAAAGKGSCLSDQSYAELENTSVGSLLNGLKKLEAVKN